MPAVRRPPSKGPTIRVTKGSTLIYKGPDRRSGIDDRKSNRRVLENKRTSEFRPILEEDVGKTIPLEVWAHVKKILRTAWNVDSKGIMDSMGTWRILGPFPEKDTVNSADPGPRIIQLDNLSESKRVLIRANRFRTTVVFSIATTKRLRPEDRRKYDRRTGKGFDVKRE